MKLWLLGPLGVLLIGGGATSARIQAQAGTGLCTPLLPSHTMMLHCYPPSHETQAEHLLPFRPVPPLSAVSESSRLALTQILLPERYHLDSPPTGNNPFTSIFYVFGAFPTDRRGEPDPSRATPKYLLISETIGDRVHPGIVVRRSFDLFAPFAVNRNGRPPWEFDATLPAAGARATLHLSSNLSRSVMRSIGVRVRARGLSA